MQYKDESSSQSAGLSHLELDLQAVVDGMEDELVIVDEEYRIRFANSVAGSRYQKGAESPIGKLCYQVLHGRDRPCSAPLWDCRAGEVLRSGRSTAVIHPTEVLGVSKFFKITMYPIRDGDGNINAVAELTRDVTTERELETQILRRHHQLLALSHISSTVSERWDLNAILRIALDIVLEIINGSIGGILLLDEETGTLYYRIQRGLSARYAEEVRIRLGEGIAGRVAQTGEPILVEDVSKDDRVAHKDLVGMEGLKGFASVPLKTTNKVIGVMNLSSHMPGRFTEDDLHLLTAIGHQIGTAIEQARLYERLAKASERYQALLRHSLTAQEEERKRIARELHDETAQALTSITLSLQALISIAEMKGIGEADFVERLRKTHSYAVHASNEIVKLMKELRPTLLDELGLPAAINRYAKNALEPQGIGVSAEFKGMEQRLPREVEVELFRISQGAIGNILEHSGAKHISIKLECNSTRCVLRIEDDGKGFDVSKITQVDPSGRGAGLFTMKERVKLIGGRCYIDSQPGQGTKVIVQTPLAKDIAYEEDKGPIGE